jgi:hypothetical protein
MTPAARLRDGFECVLPVLHTTPYLTNFFLQIANTFFFQIQSSFPDGVVNVGIGWCLVADIWQRARACYTRNMDFFNL